MHVSTTASARAYAGACDAQRRRSICPSRTSEVELGSGLARRLEESDLTYGDEGGRDESDVAVGACDTTLEGPRVQLRDADAGAVTLRGERRAREREQRWEGGGREVGGRWEGSRERRVSNGSRGQRGCGSIITPVRVGLGGCSTCMGCGHGVWHLVNSGDGLLKHLHRLDLALLLEFGEVDLHPHLGTEACIAV
jgi:hypothetical protein